MRPPFRFDGLLSRPLIGARLKAIQPFLPAAGRLLDVGCGLTELPGILSSYLGCDRNEEILVENRRRHPRARFVRWDVEAGTRPRGDPRGRTVRRDPDARDPRAPPVSCRALSRAAALLSSTGRILATTPHPLGRFPLEAGAPSASSRATPTRSTRRSSTARRSRGGGRSAGLRADALPAVPGGPEPAGRPDASMKNEGARRAIEVVGARTHNLRNVSCRIPIGAITVVTGPVGLGKVVARLRHALRRGAAALRRVDVDVRPPVPRADGEARRRPDRPPPAGARHRAEVAVALGPVDRRDRDRDPRRPPAPLRRHGDRRLPLLRPEVRRESPRERPTRSSPALARERAFSSDRAEPAAGVFRGGAAVWVGSGSSARSPPTGASGRFDAETRPPASGRTSREARRRAARPASGRPGAARRRFERRLLRRGGRAPRAPRGRADREGRPFPARPRVQRLRPLLSGADPGPLLLQLPARRLPRPARDSDGSRASTGEDPPGSREDDRRAPLRPVQHAGLRERLPRPRPRLPAARRSAATFRGTS